MPDQACEVGNALATLRFPSACFDFACLLLTSYRDWVSDIDNARAEQDLNVERATSVAFRAEIVH
ncbi:hypothetical protein [Antrihabitans spumae]|uniref:Uncharacterized protein n=1 Tax=Antrihabitans spumae TaxID=3373370 RepID=A0ABW7KL48_9NOCA